ncbi:MAG TPA: nucleotide exchange factor GrpE [Aggregatilineales bacterium]|nr:nucleotide exchange factor GrpE [Aggregatilineales bacterium]
MDPTQAPDNTTNGDPANANGTNGAADAASGPPEAEKPTGVNLMAELIEAQNKSKEYLEALQRERAEFTNYRRRMDRERDEVYQTATLDTLKKLLPVIDDFDRAIATIPADKTEDELARGVTLIHRKLTTLLETAGVKIINPVGEAFDPTYHEALGYDTSDTVPSGHITSVLQKGYMYGDRVIRPAVVRIAR